MEDIIVGLDIGTCNTRVVIGLLHEDNNVEIIGVSQNPSEGVRNGVIVNIDACKNVIQKTIEDAELMAGVQVVSVFTAIGGSQIESLNSRGNCCVDPSGKNRSIEISESTKARAIESAKAVIIPSDKTLLHVIPQEYFVDGTSTQNPLKTFGVRLDACVHLVLASLTAYSTIQECMSRANYYLNSIMLKTLASTTATIHNDEMELGSILIDMGGGTTDVIVVKNNAPVFTASIPVGGNLVTNDIAYLKGIPSSIAERIKIESGACWCFGNEKNEEVIIPGVGGRGPETMTRYNLVEIIQPRVSEIFEMVRKEIVKKSNIGIIHGSIVLTGGGALMPGVVELCQEIFETTSVRIGGCASMGVINECYREPDFATAVGLVLVNKDFSSSQKSKKKARKFDSGESVSGFFSNVKRIFSDFF